MEDGDDAANDRFRPIADISTRASPPNLRRTPALSAWCRRNSQQPRHAPGRKLDDALTGKADHLFGDGNGFELGEATTQVALDHSDGDLDVAAEGVLGVAVAADNVARTAVEDDSLAGDVDDRFVDVSLRKRSFGPFPGGGLRPVCDVSLLLAMFMSAKGIARTSTGMSAFHP